MIRETLVILALFSQTVTALGRPALVLCTHESGRSSIEYRWATCCRGEEEACATRLGSIEEADSLGSHEDCEADDPCSDSAWSPDEISSRTSASVPLTVEVSFVLTLLNILRAVLNADIRQNVWPTAVPLALGPPALLRTIVLIV